jgi:hypothetical protein
MKNHFVWYPSPAASRHPLPSGEGFALKHFPIWRTLVAGRAYNMDVCHSMNMSRNGFAKSWLEKR